MDADPEIAATRFLEYCRSRSFRPDVYLLRVYMTQTLKWHPRAAAEVERIQEIQS